MALDEDELRLLNAIGRLRTLEPGEALIWQGDESVLVANVIEGVLKLSTGTEDGREQIVDVAYPSEFIGRPFASTTDHGVTALTRARLCVFGRRDFDAFAGEHPALEHQLLERTLAELDRTRRWMVLLGRKSAPEKLASFLLELAERTGSQGRARQVSHCAQQIRLPVSRRQIADVLGVTIETVSRQFSRLKQEGIIALPSPRAVVIVDHEALAAIAG
jgi:CRP/FNR family transcriptional regulator